MNVTELAKTCGAEDQGAGLLGGAFIGAVRVDWLEQLAKAIRAEALEEAAKVCDEIFERVKADAVMHGINVDNWGSCERAAAIRGLI